MLAKINRALIALSRISVRLFLCILIAVAVASIVNHVTSAYQLWLEDRAD